MRKRLQPTFLIVGILILAGRVSPLSQPIPLPVESHRFDVNHDGQVSPSDALAIIEYLNDPPLPESR